MSNMRNIFMSAAVIAATALPVFAGDQAGLGAAYVPASTLAIEQSDTRPTTVNEIMGRANAAFFGNTVYSTDGRAVGTVQSVSLDQDGSWKLSVILASDVASKADTFMFNVAADSVATGAVIVPLSEAELVTTLNKQLTPAL